MSTHSARPVSVGSVDEIAGSIRVVPSQAAGPSDSPQGAPNVRPRPKYLDPGWKNEGVPETKFFKEYPADAWGEEASPNARVWKIYRDEMSRADTAMLRSWNETLDVLLIFAGLFSAVSTAFIIESYKALQPDYTQYIANILYAASAGSTTLTGARATLPFVGSLDPPDSFVHPSTTQRWTNGLWFTSLVVSLTVALLCILIKQWLSVYTERTARSASSLQDWARRHQLYYRGLDAWGLPALISLLPLFIHIALFLFFAGLVLFLRPLDDTIADTLLVILAFTLIFYVLCLAAPLWRVECPSYAPLLTQAHYLVSYALEFLLYLVRVGLPSFTNSFRFTTLRSDILWRLEVLVRRSKDRFTRETSAIKRQHFELDGHALSTLLVSINDSDVVDAAVEAVGAISAESTLEVVVRDVPQEIIEERTCREPLSTDATSSAFAILTDVRRVRTLWQLSVIRMRFPSSFRTSAQTMVDLSPILGPSGTMLQFIAYGWHSLDSSRLFVLAATLRDELSAYVDELSSQAENATESVDNLHPMMTVNRATCRLFLAVLHRGGDLGKDRTACILLTFCAGNFSTADAYEQTLILRSMRTALRREPDEATPSRDDSDAVLEALDRLCFTLATHEDYLADPQLARFVILHLGLLSDSICYFSLEIGRLLRPQWSQLTGLAAFLSSPVFARHVSRVGLDLYMHLLSLVDCEGSHDASSFEEYWTCVVAQLSLCYTFEYRLTIRHAHGDSQWGHFELLRKLADMLSDLLRFAAFVQRTHEALLGNFFRLPAAIGSRVGDGFIDYDAFISIAKSLSLILCCRQRLHLMDADLVELLFTGPFLANQFRRLMTGESNAEKEQRHQWIMTLARHCARLSSDAVQRICGELENRSENDLALGDEELALVAKIRRGIMPDGELTGECDATCSCMPPARAESSLTRWRKRTIGLATSAFTSNV